MMILTITSGIGSGILSGQRAARCLGRLPQRTTTPIRSYFIPTSIRCALPGRLTPVTNLSTLLKYPNQNKIGDYITIVSITRAPTRPIQPHSISISRRPTRRRCLLCSCISDRRRNLRRRLQLRLHRLRRQRQQQRNSNSNSNSDSECYTYGYRVSRPTPNEVRADTQASPTPAPRP